MDTDDKDILVQLRHLESLRTEMRTGFQAMAERFEGIEDRLAKVEYGLSDVRELVNATTAMLRRLILRATTPDPPAPGGSDAPF